MCKIKKENKTGRKLKELRGGRNQEEMALAAGVTVSAWSMYECGKRIPRDAVKIRIASFFGLTVQEIFYEEA